MNWWTSNLRSSNSLLEKLKFSQTDSNYKKNWYTSKIESSNSSLTNSVYEMNKKLIICASWFSIKKSWFFSVFQSLSSLHEKNWEPISSMKQLGKNKNLHSWNSLFKNLNLFANWFSRSNEVMNFKTSKLK